MAAGLLLLAPSPAASQEAACANPIACENARPGSPQADWYVADAGDPSMEGFATSMSTSVGGTVDFKIKAATSNYRIDIYRLGWYGGDGARLIKSDVPHTGTGVQPACAAQASTGLVDCGTWSVSASWTVPSTAVSGVYIAHLKRNDTGGENQIVFVVRDDTSHSAIALQTSDATWQAYNTYSDAEGRQSLYSCTDLCPPGSPAAYKAAFKVSYNRPLRTADDSPGSWLFTGAEYSMIRFLERNGYDVSYVSGADVNSRGALLRNHSLFISSGHDEYWSAGQRTNVEAARDAGVNLAFFSGNEMFWKTRFEPSIDGSATADRTLVSYKDTHFTSPQDPVAWTGTWRDPRFTTSADNTPENNLTGQSFVVNSGTSRITVPYAYRDLRLWRNTAAATLAPGQALQLAPDSLGYEWDVDADNGYRPTGQFDLSATTVTGVERFTDYGSTTRLGGTATHNLTMYRAPSGARVFGAGTVQWAWGLDDFHSLATSDRTMRQATVNLFADMAAQPGTLQADLVGAAASTDGTPPTSAITDPPTELADGARVTLTGTASDAGGVVAGVEVSTDGGSTWHEANGTTSWSYSWIAHGHPSATIKWRAVDDSGNLEAPGAGVTVDVTCPCSIWGTNSTPPAADSSDPGAVEVGVKFRSDKFGTVSGIRFYKAAGNTGTHTGSLWTAGGQRLAQATFGNETASGWQTVTFSTPVQIQPDTTYVASYYAPNGHYSATADYFYSAPAPGPNGGATVDSPPLHAAKNAGTTRNGVFSYGPSSTFPTSSFGAANYWVDVMFTPEATPGPVSSVAATEAGKTSATVSWSPPSSGGSVTSYTITPYIGTTAQTPTTTTTGSPPATTATVRGLQNGTTYTFTVTAANPNGSGPESSQSGAVTPLTAVAPSAPTGVSADAASRAARVTWTAPASDGDSAITGYTITAYAGGMAQDAVPAGPSATSATVSGLTNGTSYTFEVTAANGAGTSPASAASNAVTPQATIFDFATPAVLDSGDTSAVELGVKFKADYDGSITGIRFYKAAGNTGTHTGSLWTAGGQRLAQATFSNETASGWQTATFASPVAVTAGTTYVASSFAPSGHYSFDARGLTSAVDKPPLHALGDSTSANGVYAYGTTSRFPTNTYNASNYWVDVLYAIPVPGAVTNVAAEEDGPSSARVTWSAPAGGGPVSSYKVTPYVGSRAQTPNIVTGAPPATGTTVTGLETGTTYTFTVRATNANGAGAESAPSNAVTPRTAVVPTAPTGVAAQPASRSARVTWTLPTSDGASAITSQTVTPYLGSTAHTPTQVSATATSATITGLENGRAYTFRVTATNGVGTSPASAPSSAVTPWWAIFDFGSPAVVDSGDSGPVEVGVKFKADYDGSVVGIRFHKALANTGTHIGSLWTANGTRLAQATFTGESASGWQTVSFASPVPITAGTTYVASYNAPNGHYSISTNGLSSAVDNPPVHALANSTSANGVFAYGPSTTFPSGSFRASNYWVDVLFADPDAPGTVTAVTATSGRLSAGVSWTPPATGGPVTSYTITPYIGPTAQTAKTISGSPPATSATFTGLAADTAYTFTVRASNAGGSGPESASSTAITPTGATAPGAPTAVSAQGDSTSAVVSWTAPGDDGGGAITGYTVTPFAGGAAQPATEVGASTTRTRISGLTNDTSYTFRVTARNAAGAGDASAGSNAVTPRPSIFGLRTPATVDSGDTGSVNLGVKFTSDVAGSITGIRFYKAQANTGTHVGALWSATGQLLGQGTFSGESASGWQTLTFDTPVPIAANTTYVASYLAPRGRYSADAAGLASGADSPPLHALANSTSRNGVFAYSPLTAFPTGSFNAGNYWVDVLFAAAA